MKQFFLNIIDSKNTLSSNRLIMITGFPIIVVIAGLLIMYCAMKAMGLPGGSAELLSTLALIATGQSVATKWKEKGKDTDNAVTGTTDTDPKQ